MLSRSVPDKFLFSLGPRTVVHPKARIIAEAGPIVIGEGNLIEEQALIINGSVEIPCEMVFPRFETIFTCMVIITSALHLPNSYPENITPDSEVEPKTMTIGMNNVFEVGCGILCDLLDFTYSTSHIIFYTHH